MLPSIALVFYPFTVSATQFMGAVADNSTLVIDKVALAQVAPPLWEVFPFYYAPRKNLLPLIDDVKLSLAAPFLGHWLFCAFWGALDISGWKWLIKYRICEPEEVTRLNIATASEVVRAVVIEQCLQTIIGLWWLNGRSDIENPSLADHTQAMTQLASSLLRTMGFAFGEQASAVVLSSYAPQVVWWMYWYMIPAIQMFVALFLLDTWQYFGHRLFHANAFLYNHFHSVHHRLYVPYCFGALYNNWVEAILLDIVGAVIAHEFAQMSVRQGMLMFTLATVKTVDDHCGYAFPWDPLHVLFANNTTYHDIHHRTWGIKFNYSQPFFIHWDNLLGTRWRGDTAKLAKDKDM